MKKKPMKMGMKAGSPMDRAMEKKMGIKAGSAADKRMEAGLKSKKKK